jgi:hypothetical protein
VDEPVTVQLAIPGAVAALFLICCHAGQPLD